MFECSYVKLDYPEAAISRKAMVKNDRQSSKNYPTYCCLLENPVRMKEPKKAIFFLTDKT